MKEYSVDEIHRLVPEEIDIGQGCPYHNPLLFKALLDARSALAKVNARLEMAVEALEHIRDRDYQLVNLGWKGKELQRFAKEAIAKIKEIE